jgi:hypothetical protein
MGPYMENSSKISALAHWVLEITSQPYISKAVNEAFCVAANSLSVDEALPKKRGRWWSDSHLMIWDKVNLLVKRGLTR